jgi:NDP-sugar pyrophosphorylase family protein
MADDTQTRVAIERYVSAWSGSPWALLGSAPPWALPARLPALLEALIATLAQDDDYQVDHGITIHRSARIEAGAVLKGPLVVGPRCFIATGAYLRGGNWLGADCSVGPGVELKSSLVFDGSTIAHFNFIGDAIVGAGVNFEAGSIVANHRNERADKRIRVRINGRLHTTDVSKFGALIGDGCRIGANAVIAPGALLLPATVVGRTALHDDETEPAVAATRPTSHPEGTP